MVEQSAFDLDPTKVYPQILCPYIPTDDAMYRFKWALTIAYNYYLINSDEYHFEDSPESSKVQLLMKTETETTQNPE